MIALVFCGDLKYCPYINRYIERLEISGDEYKIYFWNRSGFDIEKSSRYVYFNKNSSLTKGKIGKIIDFVQFRSWLIKKINQDKPSGVVALSTLTGVILGSFLYQRHKNYVFDIRDYSYEHIKPFYWIEEKVIKNSRFTAISSKGFEAFLPEHDYVIAHNFNRKDIIHGMTFRRKEEPIQFVWNGVIRYLEFQKQYLESLKNDNRFNIVFHGDGPQFREYEEYCESNKYENMKLTGSYNNNEKGQLLRNAGILNNCYGYTHGAGNKLKYAVSNRFYDGIIYHIPQLVEPNGYKSEWVLECGIGINYEPCDEFANRLYNYYINIVPEQFDRACDDVLRIILKEDDTYIELIDRFIYDSSKYK